MWTSTRSKGIAKPGSNILLIIAHPDDEAIFFSPLLITLKENLCNVSMLCLSTGGFDGLGSTRRVELMKSADCYGIDHKCVKIIDNDQLQDGKDSIWSPDIVRDVILEYMSNTEFDAIITFDERGVSDHPNHIATFRGVQLLLRTLSRRNRKVVGLKLQSTNCLRKFVGIFDIPFSLLFSEHVVMNLNLFLVMKGMAAHKSQNVWYRILFIIFSRYSYVNTFVAIK